MQTRALGAVLSVVVLSLACGKSSKLPDPCAACEAPTFCAARECRKPGSPLVAGAVGSAAGQFGAEDRDEAMPEAPMSLAVNADASRVVVLDQVNRRIQVFEHGELTGDVPLTTATAEDVVLRPGGGYAVVDRVADQLLVLAQDGKPVASTSLTGDGVRESGAVWSSYSRPDGVWLAAGPLFVRVLGAAGEVLDKRTLRTGLPSFDGEFLYTVRSLSDRSVEIVRRNAQGKPSYKQAQIVFEDPSEVLLQSELDAAGNLYLVTEKSQPDVEHVVRRARILNADLEIVRETALATDISARQSFKQVAVSESGALAELEVTADQVQVRRY